MQGTLRVLMIGTMVLPVPALAQAQAQAQVVTGADLVGTWITTELSPREGSAVPQVTEYLITFRGDSTWSTHKRVDGKEGVDTTWNMAVRVRSRASAAQWVSSGRWALASDILWLGAVLEGQLRRAPYEIARLGEQLILGALGAECLDAFRRVDVSKPLPPPALAPSTVKRADLVGTWVATSREKDNNWQERSDTLTLRPDSTVTYRGVPATWTLLPGNVLSLQMARSLAHILKVVAQGPQLALSSSTKDCVADAPILYHPVSP